MAIVQLEKLNPSNPAGTLLDTWEAAVDLLNWARTVPEYTCRVSDRIDGSFDVQIEGINMGTAKASEGQWIVADEGRFLVLSPEEFAAVYKIAGT